MSVLDTMMEIESIITAVKQGVMTRDEATSLIVDVLQGIPPHPMTEEGINS